MLQVRCLPRNDRKCNANKPSTANLKVSKATSSNKIGALIIAYTMLGVPYYKIIAYYTPKTPFYLLGPLFFNTVRKWGPLEPLSSASEMDGSTGRGLPHR